MADEEYDFDGGDGGSVFSVLFRLLFLFVYLFYNSVTRRSSRALFFFHYLYPVFFRCRYEEEPVEPEEVRLFSP